MNEQLKNDLCHVLAAVGVNMAIAGLSYRLTQEQANASRDNVQKCLSVDVPTPGQIVIYIDRWGMGGEPHLYGAVASAMMTSQFRATVEGLFANSSKPEINCLKPYLFFKT